MNNDPEEWDRRIREALVSLPRPLPSDALHARLRSIVQTEAGMLEGTLYWTNGTARQSADRAVWQTGLIIDYQEITEIQEGFPVSATYSFHQE